MTFSRKQTEERGKKKSLTIDPTNLKNPVTINHNQNPQTQQNNGISKNHKSSKTMASTKPTKTINPQTHQQNSSTNPKPATTDHMHQQIYKRFKPIKSSSHLLCGFLIIYHRPPHNRPNPTIQTKTYKTPTHPQKTHILCHRSKSKLTHYKTHNHGATTKTNREVKSVNLPQRCH